MKKKRPSAPARQHPQKTRISVWYILISTFLFVELLLGYATSLMLPPNPATELTLALERTQKYPWSVGNHLILAGIYYTSGNSLQAKLELTLAQEMLSYTDAASPAVLGEMSQLSALQTKIETTPAKYQKNRVYWQEILTRHPNYRDGWIQLLYLSFNEDDIVSARFYLGKLNELNPNYVQELPESLRNL